MFKPTRNLPAGYYVAEMKGVLGLSEPTCWALCCRGAGCLSGVRTYLPGTVLQGCRMFKRCRNQPAAHCVAGVQDV